MGITHITGTQLPTPSQGAFAGPRLTYSDALEHLDDFCRGHSVGASAAMLRRAVLHAYDELIHARDWSFLQNVYRLTGHAAVTGSLDYDHDTLQATVLGDDTWPAWAEGASLYLDGVVCDINRRLSATVVQLDDNRNPGADLAGESFTLFQRWIALPEDFLSMEDPLAESYRRLGQKVSFEELIQDHRWSQTTGTLRRWAVGPGPGGGQAIYLHPALADDVRIDVSYRRRPRDLVHSGQDAADTAGTISTSGTGVVGSGTSFAATMVGSVLRIGRNGNLPTGREGDNPYATEAIVRSVEGPTALTLETSAGEASGIGYRVSCPLSIGRGCWDALLRIGEKRLARMLNLKEYRSVAIDAEDALRKAKGTDHGGPTVQVMRPGGHRWPARLADLA